MSDKKCVNIAVLTVSDTRTDADDKSGQVLVDRIKDAGHHLVEKKISITGGIITKLIVFNNLINNKIDVKSRFQSF